MIDSRSALRAALHARFGQDFEVPADLPGVDELLRIATHATHRAWAPEPIDPALVKLLAACALSAPSKSDLQQADIVHVRDPVRRAAVEALVPSMPWMRDAPVLLVFCGNGRRFRRLFERRGQPFVNEHLDALFNPAVDAALVLMNFVRAATAAGLVCCPISLLRDRADRLAEILAMPDHVFPVAGLCVGRPREPRSIAPRLSLEATFHVDRYGEGEDDGPVDEFDRRYAAARARFVATAQGPGAAPAGWSEQKLAQYARPQRPDWGAFLRSRGFDTR